MNIYVKKAHDTLNEVNKVILGKQGEIKEIMAAFLSNGHILLEDIPGVGKTTLALAFSRAMDLSYRRVQFTPDVMPSDLTGFSVYRREEDRFVYLKGSVFCNLLLADELNRTSPKTQSALLEVMEERKVTVEGVTRDVPSPFLVIATQNPFGNAGTQMLPEAQVDRFTASLSIGYPDYENELMLAKSVTDQNRLDSVGTVLNTDILLHMQKDVHNVFISDEVYHYILNLISETRRHPYIERGASPRATIALVKMSKAYAWLDGKTFVTPGDVYSQFPYVVAHRLILNSQARMQRISKYDVISQILSNVKRPSLGE